MDFYHLLENIRNSWIQDTGLDFLEIASKKVVHKADEILGNKIS